MNFFTLGSLAMKDIGALATGEDPTAAELQDALTIANMMLDSWNAERLMVFTITRQVFPLVVGQQTYALGIGGDFNIARPPRLEPRAGIISLSNAVQPLELPLEMLTDQQWADIPVKNILSALPQKMYNDDAFPLMNLSFWCIPSATVNVALYYWTTLLQFPDLATDIEYPPGYQEAVRYALAMRLVPQFLGPYAQAPPIVTALAISSVARIKSFNTPLVDLRVDAALNAKGRHYNWRSDTYQ